MVCTRYATKYYVYLYFLFQIPWQVEKSTEHILDIIAQNVPVMSAKENSYNFSIHIDLYNKDMQN